jgi:hypothetical protein
MGNRDSYVPGSSGILSGGTSGDDPELLAELESGKRRSEKRSNTMKAKRGGTETKKRMKENRYPPLNERFKAGDPFVYKRAQCPA